MDPLTENHQGSQNCEGTHGGATLSSSSFILPRLAVTYIVYNQLVFKQLRGTNLLAVPSSLSPPCSSYSFFLSLSDCNAMSFLVFSSFLFTC